MSIDIAKSEIVDWWDAERSRILTECEYTSERIKMRLRDAFAQFSNSDILNPRSKAYTAAKKSTLASLEMLSRRLNASIRERVNESIQIVERGLTDDEVGIQDHLTLLAPGAAAVGAVGMLVAAASLTTVTTTFLVVIPVTTVSWPLVAVFGASAVTLGYMSPSFLKWSIDGLRAKYLASLEKQVDVAVFGKPGSRSSGGIADKYLAQIDGIFDQRLEHLS